MSEIVKKNDLPEEQQRAKVPYRRSPVGNRSSWSARNLENTALSGNLYSPRVEAHCIKDGVAIEDLGFDVELHYVKREEK